MMLASALGALGSFWAYLSMYYSEGGFSSFGRESFNRLETWLTYAAPPDVPAIGFRIVRIRPDVTPRRNADAIHLVELTPCRLRDLRELGN